MFAAAFEAEYPGYGARFVWLAFATGMRICELLALRWDSFDLVSMTVAVDWQLNRHRAWPAVKPPKSGKQGGCGVHAVRVQKWLGHQHLSTTLDTYVHGPARVRTRR